MWFEQIIRKETGCASYMIGSTKTGECMVFDPLWDITPYVTLAKQKGAQIRYIIDSHTHADHVSGARRLAALSGGELVLHRLAAITYAATQVADGDTFQMGEVLLKIVHTPGHRPEMMSLLVTDRSRGEQPWCLLTGDFILVGDLGRPDLAQEGEEGAQMLFDQALPRLRALDDYVEIYPGHVAGSTCGRVSSGKTVTTVGYERRFNWLLQTQDRDHFTAEMNAEQPVRPANLVNIVAINQGKRPLTMATPKAPALLPAAVADCIDAGHLVIDTRSAAHFAAGHLPGAYHIPVDNPNFEQWVGWVTPPDRPLLLDGESEAEIERALHKLAFLGLDQRVKGFVSGGRTALASMGRPPVTLPQLTVQQLYQRLQPRNQRHPLGRPFHVLDVREVSEWESGHVAHAHQMSFKQLADRLPDLPFQRTDPVAVICASGARASLAASILLHHGYQAVYHVIGGMTAWRNAGLTTVEDDEVDEAILPLPLLLQLNRHVWQPRIAEKIPSGSNPLPYWLELSASPN